MRTIQGTVISTKMDKTIVVETISEKSHPKYHKKYKVSKKFYAHDESGVCKEWDTVTIVESRPLSKLKRWTLEGDAQTDTPTAKKATEEKKTPAKKPAAKKTTPSKAASTKKPAAKKTTEEKK